MRRLAATAVALLALAVGLAPAGAVAPAPATVKVSSCSLATHSAVFHARMKTAKGTARMAMRISLQERGADGRFRTVEAPGLSRWRKSKPGVGGFGIRQRVRNLDEGQTYRARVDFRWVDADGETILRTRRRSRTCRQVGALPNLRVTTLSLAPRGDLPKGVARYRAGIENAGKGKAAAFTLRLSVDGSVVDAVDLPGLEPGESRQLEFTGPACQRPGSPVKATADPDRAVPETRERDNSRRVRCDQLAG